MEEFVVYDFDSIRETVINIFDDSGWVKWIHDWTTPAQTQQDKLSNIAYASISKHCAKCLNINGCCFSKNNMPEYPDGKIELATPYGDK